LTDAVPLRPGEVVQYSYLWAYEELAGHVDGRKDRPCAVMIVQATEHIVAVCPITHTPPKDGLGVPVPPRTLARLGLDDAAPCWIITTELNQFIWPGPDLRKTPAGRPSYGLLPRAVFEQVRSQLLANHARGLTVVHRADEY